MRNAPKSVFEKPNTADAHLPPSPIDGIGKSSDILPPRQTREQAVDDIGKGKIGDGDAFKNFEQAVHDSYGEGGMDKVKQLGKDIDASTKDNFGPNSSFSFGDQISPGTVGVNQTIDTGNGNRDTTFGDVTLQYSRQ
jgi:hypothetical protein